ncbi:MAG: lactonase family protein [Spirochaetales bacterium]|nr:lactonase family protein [Spirochaetales bacterium]
MSESKFYLYVGTFTRPAPYLEETNGEGIYIYRYDPDEGNLVYQGETQGIDSPSYISFDREGKFLYANSEIWGWDEGLVKAYAVDQSDGSLTYLNMQPSRGSLTSYISVDKTNSHVLVTNYWTGSVVLFRREEDGSLSPVIDKSQHEGTGPDPERQEGPHCHCVLMDPSNTFAYVADLGLDLLVRYRLDREKGRLLREGETALPPGSGPRHLIFHPSGNFVFVSGEMGSLVFVLKRDPESGGLELIESCSTVPEGFEGISHCSDLHVTPDGRFLYVGNRGHDSIAAFVVDPESGKLTPRGQVKTQGRTPRNFVIDPAGKYLLAANQDSDNINIFTINQETGELSFTGKSFDAPTPVCLKFLEIKE